MDCGSACLAMIVKFYGMLPVIETIRASCDLSKDGVSLLGISKAAEEIGFKTVGGRLSFETLANEAPLPCIVHWNQNHFVVVYKIKKHRKGRFTVYVADPGKGSIATISYGRGKGHVGFVVGKNSNGQILILGGNQGAAKKGGQNEVNISPNSASKFKYNYPAGHKPYYNLPVLNIKGKAVSYETTR